jgi:DNA-binding winged helix-turn-helix (wHTH) protein/TolB-like protein/lipoprotein NlpI
VQEARPHIYEFGDFRLDAARRLLTARDGRVVPLTPKPFETLLYLVRHSGAVLDKDELMQAVWPDTVVEENNLSQSISALRRALGEKPGQHRYIVTVPGRGFRFVAPVSAHADAETPSATATVSPGPEAERAGAIGAGAVVNDRPAGGLRANVRLVALAAALILILGGASLFLWRARTGMIAVAPPVASSAPVKTIAVLPFKPLLQTEQDQALELGMADTLIAKLSNSRELVVRPISAVRRYGALEQDPQAAGHELNVEAVLDGYIQRRDDRIRVTARLVGTDDGRQMWAGQFDEKVTDIFAVQDAISERVAAALALRLTGAERARLKRRETANIEAYEVCLRGRYFLAKRRPEAVNSAVEHFRQAIALDPNYAQAYAGLADAYGFLLNGEYGGMPPPELIPKAKEAALKAVALDDTLAEAHAALGRILGFERDWRGAELELKRGLELDPDNADGLRYYAVYLVRVEKFDESLRAAQRAWELEPGAAGRMHVLGWIYYYRREYDQAIEQFRQALEVDPNLYSARFKLGLAYLQKGMFDEAVAELRKTVSQSGGNARHVAFLGYAYARSGRRGEAQQLLNELQAKSGRAYVPHYDLAIIHLGLGDKERALELLGQAEQERDDWLLFLKVEPVMDSLRSDPRFQDLLRRVGLPQ